MLVYFILFFFFFKQKTAYEMRISDWSSDVCSSDLNPTAKPRRQIETTSSLNALMLVRAGTGVALIDPLTATTLSPEGVVFRAIDRHIPYLMGVIKHRDRALPGEGSRLVQALWDHASASVPRFEIGRAHV